MINIEDWKDFQKFRAEKMEEARANKPEFPQPKYIQRSFLWFKWTETAWPSLETYMHYDFLNRLARSIIPKNTIEAYLDWVSRKTNK